ncbi:Iron-sulfur assembly protein 1 [Tulasnella sp. 419]|nr:Iron-sulfur assembly protein 1 [Tulasnella sp. 418]KAG8961206.1 Iron-sulfur assembly protein 1 [Tulasnella sp. 419]
MAATLLRTARIVPLRSLASTTRPALIATYSSSTLPSSQTSEAPLLPNQPPTVIPNPSPSDGSVAGPIPPPPQAEKSPRKAPKLRATKAALTLTPTAIERLKGLSKGPTPQLIRIGVKNKGCAGMSYVLDYVEKPGKFDEIVEQDGVKVLIDSKALFSIIGSEMDWKEDRMSSKFAFKNPNVIDSCGCGESFSL